MSKDEIFAQASIKLGMNSMSAETNSKLIEDVGYYFWESGRGGQQFIIGFDGGYLFGISALSFDVLVDAYKSGTRTALKTSNKKPMYEYIDDLLDYSDELIALIQPENFENPNYFMSLIYIEDILDKYGRGLVSKSANEDGLDGHALLVKANRRMDELRKSIRSLSEAHDFDDIIKERATQMVTNWVKRN